MVKVVTCVPSLGRIAYVHIDAAFCYQPSSVSVGRSVGWCDTLQKRLDRSRCRMESIWTRPEASGYWPNSMPDHAKVQHPEASWSIRKLPGGPDSF